jgi:hypothetical protein
VVRLLLPARPRRVRILRCAQDDNLDDEQAARELTGHLVDASFYRQQTRLFAAGDAADARMPTTRQFAPTSGET